MKTKEKEKLEKKLTKEIDRLKNSTELLLTDATMIQWWCLLEWRRSLWGLKKDSYTDWKK